MSGWLPHIWAHQIYAHDFAAVALFFTDGYLLHCRRLLLLVIAPVLPRISVYSATAQWYNARCHCRVSKSFLWAVTHPWHTPARCWCHRPPHAARSGISSPCCVASRHLPFGRRADHCHTGPWSREAVMVYTSRRCPWPPLPLLLLHSYVNPCIVTPWSWPYHD